MSRLAKRYPEHASHRSFPVEALFTAELETGELMGSNADSVLLTNAFLHRARGITFRPEGPDLPDKLIRLFIGGARPRNRP